MYVCIYIYMYVYVYIHTYIYIYSITPLAGVETKFPFCHLVNFVKGASGVIRMHHAACSIASCVLQYSICIMQHAISNGAWFRSVLLRMAGGRTLEMLLCNCFATYSSGTCTHTCACKHGCNRHGFVFSYNCAIARSYFIRLAVPGRRPHPHLGRDTQHPHIYGKTCGIV